MIFSNPTEYAIRALSELVIIVADSEPRTGPRAEYLMLNKLVEDTTLPREFLAKIFRQLVEKGVLKSAKGPGGGFALARPAKEITLLDIMQAIEGENQVERCVVGLAKCNDEMPCPQHDLFKPIRQRLRSYLSNTTLAETAASLREKRALGAKDAAPGKAARRRK